MPRISAQEDLGSIPSPFLPSPEAERDFFTLPRKPGCIPAGAGGSAGSSIRVAEPQIIVINVPVLPFHVCESKVGDFFLAQLPQAWLRVGLLINSRGISIFYLTPGPQNSLKGREKLIYSLK